MKKYTLKWWLCLLEKSHSFSDFHISVASKHFKRNELQKHEEHLALHVRYNVLRQRIAIRIADKYGE